MSFSAACLAPLALGFLQTSAKAHDQVQLFPGALKRSSPRMNAGAPTIEPSAAPTLRIFFNRSRFSLQILQFPSPVLTLTLSPSPYPASFSAACKALEDCVLGVRAGARTLHSSSQRLDRLRENSPRPTVRNSRVGFSAAHVTAFYRSSGFGSSSFFCFSSFVGGGVFLI